MIQIRHQASSPADIMNMPAAWPAIAHLLKHPTRMSASLINFPFSGILIVGSQEGTNATGSHATNANATPFSFCLHIAFASLSTSSDFGQRSVFALYLKQRMQDKATQNQGQINLDLSQFPQFAASCIFTSTCFVSFLGFPWTADTKSSRVNLLLVCSHLLLRSSST